MGLPLPESEITQTVFPNIFFMSIMGTLSPSTVCRSSGWAGMAQLVDPLVLTSQVAFATYVYQSLKVPPPNDLSVVFHNLLYCSIFLEAGE